MGINSINNAAMSGGRTMADNQAIDTVSKNLQDKISTVQRQRRELSSKEGMSDEERTKKREELQQELRGLNVQLRQRQAQMRKDKHQELFIENDNPDKDKAVKAADAKENAKKTKPVDTKDKEIKAGEIKTNENKGIEDNKQRDTRTDTTSNKNTEIKAAKDNGISKKNMNGIIGADFVMEQAQSQRIVIARMEEGIVILKGEIKQDKIRGVDTSKKQEELQRQERRVRDAYSSQASNQQKSGNPIRNAKVANAAKKQDSRRNIINASDFSEKLMA